MHLKKGNSRADTTTEKTVTLADRRFAKERLLSKGCNVVWYCESDVQLIVEDVIYSVSSATAATGPVCPPLPGLMGSERSKHALLLQSPSQTRSL